MKTNSTKKARIREMSAAYPRVIEWSAEDKCFVGSAPPLVGQCCHGDTTTEVAAQLDAIVADLVEDVIDGKIPTSASPEGKTYSGKFVVRISPALHQRAALQAAARGESLNQFVADALTHA